MKRTSRIWITVGVLRTTETYHCTVFCLNHTTCKMIHTPLFILQAVVFTALEGHRQKTCSLQSSEEASFLLLQEQQAALQPLPMCRAVRGGRFFISCLFNFETQPFLLWNSGCISQETIKIQNYYGEEVGHFRLAKNNYLCWNWVKTPQCLPPLSGRVPWGF